MSSAHANLDTWLAEALSGGHWVTIHGLHVYINHGGTISAGPKGLIGANLAHLPGTPTHQKRGVEPAGARAHPDFTDRSHGAPPPALSGEQAIQHFQQAQAHVRASSKAFAMRAAKHFAAYSIKASAEAEYRTRFGNVISADNARELSPEYAHSAAARSMIAPALQEPASAMSKRMYAEALAAPTPKGTAKMVVFTAGGPGSGKSTAIDSLPEVKHVVDSAKIVYDSMMAGLASATKRVDQALAANHHVAIYYVYRDPVDSFAHGVLPRAETGGRTLPLSLIVEGHLDANTVIRQLADHYKDNPHVQIHVIDNSRGRGHQAEVPLASLPASGYTKAQLTAKLSGILEDARNGRNGQAKISEHVYDGIKAPVAG